MKLLNALGFLTIIKIPQRFYLKSSEYPGILLYFPVAGLVIGIAGAILFFSLNFIFPLFLTIIIITGFEIILTGGIHIDGLADTFDGIFSGEKDKIRIIEIMKKGDTGVFGVLAIIFSVALKAAFIYFISVRLSLSRFLIIGSGFKILSFRFSEMMPGFLVLVCIIVFTPVYGRLSMMYLFSRYEPAVKTGSLTAVFKGKKNRLDFIISTVISSVIFILFSVFLKIEFIKSGNAINTGLYAIVYVFECALIIVFTLLFSAGTGRFFTRRIEGVSGDIIGSVCVLSEIFFLFLNYLTI